MCISLYVWKLCTGDESYSFSSYLGLFFSITIAEHHIRGILLNEGISVSQFWHLRSRAKGLTSGKVLLPASSDAGRSSGSFGDTEDDG